MRDSANGICRLTKHLVARSGQNSLASRAAAPNHQDLAPRPKFIPPLPRVLDSRRNTKARTLIHRTLPAHRAAQESEDPTVLGVIRLPWHQMNS